MSEIDPKVSAVVARVLGSVGQQLAANDVVCKFDSFEFASLAASRVTTLLTSERRFVLGAPQYDSSTNRWIVFYLEPRK